MARRPVSEAADHTLELWLHEVMTGQLSLAELPLSVSAWFFAGEAYGRASRQQEVEDLERQVNRFHNLAFETDKDRRDRIEERLSQALEMSTEEQWDQLEEDLATMAGRRINPVGDGAQPHDERGQNDRSRKGPQGNPRSTGTVHRPGLAA